MRSADESVCGRLPGDNIASFYVKRLVHFIREEKSFFGHRINPDTLRGIICLKGKKSTDRISSQSGAFLLFGIDAVVDEGDGNTIQVDRIRVRTKASLLAELDLLNTMKAPFARTSKIRRDMWLRNMRLTIPYSPRQRKSRSDVDVTPCSYLPVS